MRARAREERNERGTRQSYISNPMRFELQRRPSGLYYFSSTLGVAMLLRRFCTRPIWDEQSGIFWLILFLSSDVFIYLYVVQCHGCNTVHENSSHLSKTSRDPRKGIDIRYSAVVFVVCLCLIEPETPHQSLDGRLVSLAPVDAQQLLSPCLLLLLHMLRSSSSI